MFGTNEIVGRKYFRDAPADTLFVTSIFYTLQGEGPYAGMPAVFVRLAKCQLKCHFCFVPTTKVLMGNGKHKRITDVKVGDMVMSWSGDKFEPKPVTKVMTSVATELVKVIMDGAPVRCTPDHPFLTSNRGWVKAGELQAGDKIVHWNTSEHMKMFNPMYNPENRSIMSAEQRERASVNLEQLWQDPEFRERNTARMTGAGNPMKNPEIAAKSYINRENKTKTGLEEKIEKICEGLPIKFVGDGQMVISYKIPDFVVEGQKKVIEVWADDARWAKEKPRDEAWMNKRRELFAKEGYDTLFLPLTQADLLKSKHQEIRNKVAEFIHNGKVVKRVERMTAESDGRFWARTYGTKSAERIVYNLEVADNHTYVANNCVVHNCDTFFDDGEWLTYTELEARIYHTICDFWNNRGEPAPAWAVNGFNSYPGIVLVMTGGEPLLQDNISQFMANQVGRYAAVQVESNGILDTHVPEGVTLVCSPKCAEKGNVAIKYFAPSKTILERADCLKFVMSADKASPYSSIPDWAFDWKQKNPTKDIFVSPMNIYNTLPQTIKVLRADDQRTITMQERSTVDEKISFWEPGVLNLAENQRNHEYTGMYCAQHGLRLNLQQHIYCSLA